MSKLSERQKQILRYIEEYINENGYAPSLREIGQAVGMRSVSSVHNQLNNLENMGHIKRGNGDEKILGRTISLVNDDESGKEPTVYIPIVGKVTAGNPIEAIENVSDY